MEKYDKILNSIDKTVRATAVDITELKVDVATLKAYSHNPIDCPALIKHEEDHRARDTITEREAGRSFLKLRTWGIILSIITAIIGIGLVIAKMGLAG